MTFLVQTFKNKLQINLSEHYKPKEVIRALHRSHFDNILIDFYYLDFICCVQQRERDELDLKMYYYNYYHCDITTRLEKLKNFQINGVYVNKNNRFIVEYEFLKKHKAYSKADIVKIQTNKL